MREVNPDQNLDQRVKAILMELKEFIKFPTREITKLPHWSWKELIIVQILIAMFSGVIAGIIKFNFYRIASGLILMPFMSTLSAFLLTLFFYYYFQFFENRLESFRKLFTFVILATIPFYIFQMISEYLSFATIIGFAATSLLSTIGLVENFKVTKNRATLLAGFLFCLVLAAWIINLV